MEIIFDTFCIEPIQEKYAWRICDLMVANADRFKAYFPLTLHANLTPSLAAQFAAQKVKAFENKEEFLFVLKHTQNRSIMGLIYIKELRWKKKQAEMAYCIGYPYTGKGYSTKAVNALVTYSFSVLALDTLQIIVHADNTASKRVAEKCGFQWVRTLLKEYTPPGEEAKDMELYELTRDHL